MLMLAVLIPSRSIADQPNSFRDCADCPEMLVVPAGSFTMGSPDDEPGQFVAEGPLRRVSIRPFAVGKFDVTRRQWAAFVSATNRETRGSCFWTGRSGSKPDPAGSWRDVGFPQDDDHPVVCVTWNDARDYARWLSQRTGRGYRLLTESEWEYAARAGTATPYPWGSTAAHEYANYGRPRLSAPFRPMRSVSTTCTAMSCNGCRIVLHLRMPGYQPMALLTRLWLT